MTDRARKQSSVDVDGTERDLRSVRELRAAKSRLPVLDELADDLSTVEARELRAAVVCLVGPTGAGKSTLLNALAGVAVATEGIDRPTTTTPVVYAPSDLDEKELQLGTAAKIAHYEASDARPWSGHVLIDAPDVNSIRRDHRDTVHALAGASDVLVVVLHHQAVVEDITAQFIDGWADRRRVAVVLNRVDQLSSDAAALVTAQVRELAMSRWGVSEQAVFAVSALRARENDGDDPGFRGLVAWLAGMVDRGEIKGIRRENREGIRRRLASEVGRIAEASAGEWQLLDGSLAEGWDALVERGGEDTARRLLARRADLELALGSELAKRWRGPGGWLLKIGMWGSVGSIGALALRRNPLAAGAMAVGGQVLDRVRTSVAERRLESGGTLVPQSQEAAVWQEDAFRQARVHADALSPALASDLDACLDSASATLLVSIEEAWADVVELELPEYVGSWRMAWFRLPLDLPLYALAIDVGRRTVSAYVSGGYMPLDYYVNALALAAVAAGVCYMAGRMAVAVAGRAFLRKARKLIASRVHERMTTQAQTTSAVLEEHRRSLERLSA